MYHNPTVEDIIPYGHGRFFVNNDATPTRKHQTEEDITKVCRNFAGEIYYQRCKERYL